MELKVIFNEVCMENNIQTKLSYNMPKGYETAFGTYDSTIDTLFLNMTLIEKYTSIEILFFLYHELRHTVQYNHPELFPAQIQKSIKYVILYDGTCFKLINNEWYSTNLSGDELYFTEAYKNLPYEIDANDYAYNRVTSELGNNEELKNLYNLFKPKVIWKYEKLKEVFSLIDELI